MDRLLIPTFFCPKAWESMTGNEATRHCSSCNKHVHNLDALSVSERLALLSSSAAQICARYKIAIRRPKPGREESYARHLAKYGVGVALTGATVLVFWEMYARSHRYADQGTHYRIVAPNDIYLPDEMPDTLYDEIETTTMGAIALVPNPVPLMVRSASTICSLPATPESHAPYLDVHFDSTQVVQLLKPAAPNLPDLNLASFPLKKKVRK